MEPNLQQKVKGLEETIVKLQAQVNDLSGAFYKNNFISSQTFNKDCVFNSRLRVPVYSSAPTSAGVGDLIAVAGDLFICTTASTGGAGAVFTLVGSQS